MVIFVGRKGLTQFDSEKDEWYYQSKIYLDRVDNPSLYDDLKDFRLSLAEDVENDAINDNLKLLLDEDQQEERSGKPNGPFYEEVPYTDGLKSMVRQAGFF